MAGTRGHQEVVKDDKLGVKAPLKREICIGASSVKKVLKLLLNIKDVAIFLQIGPWTSYRGLENKSDQEVVASAFHKFFELWNKLERGELPKTRYLVVSGLINLGEDEINDSLYNLCALKLLRFLDNCRYWPVQTWKN